MCHRCCSIAVPTLTAYFQLESYKTGMHSSQRLWKWVERIEVRFEGRILTINQSVIDQWARLCGELEAKGIKLAVLDSFIAATALAYDLAVATRNVDDFSATTVKLFNPWELEC